jgi:hypothetical protein
MARRQRIRIAFEPRGDGVIRASSDRYGVARIRMARKPVSPWIWPITTHGNQPDPIVIGWFRNTESIRISLERRRRTFRYCRYHSRNRTGQGSRPVQWRYPSPASARTPEASFLRVARDSLRGAATPSWQMYDTATRSSGGLLPSSRQSAKSEVPSTSFVGSCRSVVRLVALG